MQCKTHTDILAQLRHLKPLLQARYKVQKISLFGSYVRQQQQADSDIDLLVEFATDADLFDWLGMTQYLEEQFHQRVDVVSSRTLRTELTQQVLQELISV